MSGTLEQVLKLVDNLYAKTLHQIEDKPFDLKLVVQDVQNTCLQLQKASDLLKQHNIDATKLKEKESYFVKNLDNLLRAKLSEAQVLEVVISLNESELQESLSSLPNEVSSVFEDIIVTVKVDVCENFTTYLRKENLQGVQLYLSKGDTFKQNLGLSLPSVLVREVAKNHVNTGVIKFLIQSNLLTEEMVKLGLLDKLPSTAELELLYSNNVLWYELDKALGLKRDKATKEVSTNLAHWLQQENYKQMNMNLKKILHPVFTLQKDVIEGNLQTVETYTKDLALPSLVQDISLLFSGKEPIYLKHLESELQKELKILAYFESVQKNGSFNLKHLLEVLPNLVKVEFLRKSDQFKYFNFQKLIELYANDMLERNKYTRTSVEEVFALLGSFAEAVKAYDVGKVLEHVNRMHGDKCIDDETAKGLVYLLVELEAIKSLETGKEMASHSIKVLLAKYIPLTLNKQTYNQLARVFHKGVVTDTEGFEFVINLFNALTKLKLGDVLSKEDVAFLEENKDVITTLEGLEEIEVTEYTTLIDNMLNAGASYESIFSKVPNMTHADFTSKGFKIAPDLVNALNGVLDEFIKLYGYANISNRVLSSLVRVSKQLQTGKVMDATVIGTLAKEIGLPFNFISTVNKMELAKPVVTVSDDFMSSLTDLLGGQEEQPAEEEVQVVEKPQPSQPQEEEGGDFLDLLGNLLEGSSSLEQDTSSLESNTPSLEENTPSLEENIFSLENENNSLEQGNSSLEENKNSIEEPVPVGVVTEQPIPSNIPTMSAVDRLKQQEKRSLFEQPEVEETQNYTVETNVKPTVGLKREVVEKLLMAQKVTGEDIPSLTTLLVNRGVKTPAEVKEIVTTYTDCKNKVVDWVNKESNITPNGVIHINEVEEVIDTLQSLNLHNSSLYKQAVTIAEKVNVVETLFGQVNKKLKERNPSLAQDFIDKVFKEHIDALEKELESVTAEDVQSILSFAEGVITGEADISLLDNYAHLDMYMHLLDLAIAPPSVEVAQVEEEPQKEEVIEQITSLFEVDDAEEVPNDTEEVSLFEVAEEEEQEPIEDTSEEESFILEGLDEEEEEDFLPSDKEDLPDLSVEVTLEGCSAIVGRDLKGTLRFYREAIDYIQLHLDEPITSLSKETLKHVLELLEQMQYETVDILEGVKELEEDLSKILIAFYNIKNKDTKIIKETTLEDFGEDDDTTLQKFRTLSTSNLYLQKKIPVSKKENTLAVTIPHYELVRVANEDLEGFVVYTNDLLMRIPKEGIVINKLIEMGLDLLVEVKRDYQKLNFSLYVAKEGNKQRKIIKSFAKFVTLEVLDGSDFTLAEGNVYITNEDNPLGNPTPYTKFAGSLIINTLMSGALTVAPKIALTPNCLDTTADEVKPYVTDFIQRGIATLMSGNFEPLLGVTYASTMELLLKTLGIYKDNYTNLDNYGAEPLKVLAKYNLVTELDIENIKNSMYDYISRAEMFQYLSGILDLVTGLNISVEEFTEEYVDDRTGTLLQFLDENNILKRKDGRIHLEGNVTRQEMVYYLHHTCRLVGLI